MTTVYLPATEIPAQLHDGLDRIAAERVVISAHRSPTSQVPEPQSRHAADGAAHRVAGTFSTSRHLYWGDVSGCPVASDSQGVLQQLTGATLDRKRLAVALCRSAPSALRLPSFWRRIETVRPGAALSFRGQRVEVRPPAPVVDEPSIDLPTAALSVRRLMTRAVHKHLDTYGSVSADLSGGMDSTSLAFILDAGQQDSIFYHAPTADEANHDSGFARRAAATLRGRLVELESFTSTSSAFEIEPETMQARDQSEGPLAWRSNAVHLARLLQDAATRGIRVHLTGIGGDELFEPLPALALRLLRAGSRRDGIRVLRRLGRMQRWSNVSMARAASSRLTPQAELKRRLTSEAKTGGPVDVFAWNPGFGLSRFATPWARTLVLDAIEDAVVAGRLAPHFEDRVRHQMTEALLFQGEIVRQVERAFGHLGIGWQAPFLDDDLMRFVLSLPADLLVGTSEHKPLLSRAMTGLVPDFLLSRTTKGEYSLDLFTEYRNRRKELLILFEQSCLVDLGLVDPDMVRKFLEVPPAGTADLFEIEHLVSVENWVRSLR